MSQRLKSLRISNGRSLFYFGETKIRQTPYRIKAQLNTQPGSDENPFVIVQFNHDQTTTTTKYHYDDHGVLRFDGINPDYEKDMVDFGYVIANNLSHIQQLIKPSALNQ